MHANDIKRLRSPRRAVLLATVLLALAPAGAGPACAALIGSAATPARTSTSTTLRVCADPADLPFSSNQPDRPGIYVALARHLASQLGRPLSIVWAPTDQDEEMLHKTLLAGTCDMFIGVPAAAEFLDGKVILSHPILTAGYALVRPAGSGIDDDAALAHHAVAVQFASPPQDMLSRRQDVDAVTVMSPEEGMADLKGGQVQAALLWGPSAGYLNQAAGSGYSITPLQGRHMQWQVAIAFAPAARTLRARVDRALSDDPGFMQQQARQYGFPGSGSGIQQAAVMNEVQTLKVPAITKDTAPSQDLPKSETAQDQPGPAAAGDKGTREAAFTPAGGDPVAGHSMFNGNCAHCHGPDAVTGDGRVNLRLLQVRYGAGMDQMFYHTVTHGRIDKGMPNWSGVISDQQFKSILAWLHSVQAKA